MSTCAPDVASLDICPTQDQLRQVILSYFPRGPAWGNHDGGPWPDSVLYKFADVLAATRLYLEQRICALRLEFFCASRDETDDVWLAQYGLPDACEPYPDLCTKVAAYDGPTCGDLAAAAGRAGWAVTCVDQRCAPAKPYRAGRARASGGLIPATIVLVVDLVNSPAYAGGPFTPSRAGRMRAGRRLACAPDLGGLKCLMARIVQAHVAVQYIVGASGVGELDFEQSGNPLIGLL